MGSGCICCKGWKRVYMWSHSKDQKAYFTWYNKTWTTNCSWKYLFAFLVLGMLYVYVNFIRQWQNVHDKKSSFSLSHTLFHAQFPGNKRGREEFGDVAILRSHFWMKMAIGMAPAIYGSKSGTPLGNQIFISGHFLAVVQAILPPLDLFLVAICLCRFPSFSVWEWLYKSFKRVLLFIEYY